MRVGLMGLFAVLGAVMPAPFVSRASADEMDISLSRLRAPRLDAAGVPIEGAFVPDDAAWSRLMSQLGFAIASPSLAPARTTGTRGFYMGFETSVTGIDDGASYWRGGTEGDAMSTGENRFVRSSLVASQLTMRKGLPFGLELGGSVGHLYDSQQWIWGAELRIALLEGFREGISGFVPDIAVRGAIRTLTGDSEFHLTVPSMDFTISKPIVLGGVATLTPIFNTQLLWILADSELVDLTPERDAFAECMPAAGPPVYRDPPDMSDTSTIRCTGGSAQDFGNDALFTDIRAFRARMSLGVQIRYRIFTTLLSFQWDVRSPGSTDDAVPQDLPRQWTLNIGVGATY